MSTQSIQDDGRNGGSDRSCPHAHVAHTTREAHAVDTGRDSHRRLALTQHPSRRWIENGTKTRFPLAMWRGLSFGVLLGGLGSLVASDTAVSKWTWPHRGDVGAVVKVPGESALQTTDSPELEGLATCI